MIYVTAILLSVSVILVVNVLFGANALTVLWQVSLLTVAVIAVDGIFAALIRLLPARLMRYDRRFFAVGERENAFYRRIGVKAWKPIVPDLGCFTKFPKNHLLDPRDPAYTGRYLLEAAYGIVIHLVNMAVGFLILPILPEVALTVALPVACVNFLLSLLPVFVLRSNFPALIRLHRYNERRTAHARA